MFDSEKLIELVKSRPAIYNSTSKVYRCKNVATKSWNQIAAIMGNDVQVCRSAWTGLRSSYARHLQNQKRNKEGARQKNKKPWYLADKLAFLDKHMQLTPNDRRLYSKPKGKKRTSITVDDSCTSFSISEHRSENLNLEDSISIGSIKSEEEEFELHEEINNSIKTPELFEDTNKETTNKAEASDTEDQANNFSSKKSMVKLTNEDHSIPSNQQNKRQKVEQTFQISKQIKLNRSESNLNVNEELVQSREDSIMMFFQSLLLDMRCLSDRNFRLFKQDIFKTLNKFIDEEDIDD